MSVEKMKSDPDVVTILDGIKWLEGNRAHFSVDSEGDEYWVDAEVKARTPVTEGRFAGRLAVIEFGTSYTFTPAGECQDAVLNVRVRPDRTSEDDEIGGSFHIENGTFDDDFFGALTKTKRHSIATIIRGLRAVPPAELF